MTKIDSNPDPAAFGTKSNPVTDARVSSSFNTVSVTDDEAMMIALGLGSQLPARKAQPAHHTDVEPMTDLTN